MPVVFRRSVAVGRRLAVLGIAAVLVAGCSSASKVEPSASAGTGVLQIVWHPGIFVALTYSLNCDPASGTLIDPGGVCAEISRNLSMVGSPEPTEEGPRCMEPTSSVKISGVYDRREVNVRFSRCGDPDMGGWERVLPTETLSEVSIDRGIGPFRLGESESAARALLAARAPIGKAGGLDVYKPEGGPDGLISVSCGDRLHPDHLIMAFRYDSARGLVTVIGNLEDLRLDGYTVAAGGGGLTVRKRTRTTGFTSLARTAQQLDSRHLRRAGSPRRSSPERRPHSAGHDRPSSSAAPARDRDQRADLCLRRRRSTTPRMGRLAMR